MSTDNSNNALSIEEQLKAKGMDTGKSGGTSSSSAAQVPPVTETKDSEELKAQLAKLTKENDELRKNPTIIEKILTPDEIAQREKNFEDEVVNYVVVEKKKNAADYQTYKSSKSLSAKDFLFAKYKSERLAEDKTLTEEVMMNDFDVENGLATQDEKALARANNKLEITANVVRSNEFKEFEGIADEYRSNKTKKEKEKTYNDFVGAAAPELKLSVSVEGFKDPIDIVIDYTDKMEELKKGLQHENSFLAFTAEGVDTQAKINEFILLKARGDQDIFHKALKQGIEEATKQIKLGAHGIIENKMGTSTEGKSHKGYEGILKNVTDKGLMKNEATKTA